MFGFLHHISMWFKTWFWLFSCQQNLLLTTKQTFFCLSEWIHVVSLKYKGIIPGNFVRNDNKTVIIVGNCKTACEVMWRECNIQMKSMTSYPFYYLFAHCFCSEHRWRIYWKLHWIPAFEQWSRSTILFMLYLHLQLLSIEVLVLECDFWFSVINFWPQHVFTKKLLDLWVSKKQKIERHQRLEVWQ